MLTLGVSAYYHDSAACLIADGGIIGAAHEERFTRKKYDSALPLNAIQYCLNLAGATIADVDALAFYEEPAEKRSRQNWQLAQRTCRPEMTATAGEIEAHLRDGLQWTEEIHFVEHHRAHAASAYYVSGFDNAAVLVCDAVGEWDTTTFWIGEGSTLHRLGGVQFPHSLGLFYSCLTSYLGFRPNSDEYKVMGLASYGEPKYELVLRRMLFVDATNGQIELDTRILDFLTEPHKYLRNLENLLSVPRRRSSDPVLPVHMNIAASAQAVLESAVTDLLGWLSDQQKSTNLCLAGGVALNCRANSVAYERSRFTSLFVQPAAGDAGAALGAALSVDTERHSVNFRRAEMRHAYLGPSYDGADIARMVEDAKLVYTDFRNDEAALVDTVAAALAEGRTVGWFQGRMEFGPRALGARSILADPRTAEMRDRLNSDIKWREEFRPFAPAVLAERAREFFSINRPSPFMIEVFDVRQPELLRAVTHVDGSARVQTVEEAVAPRYYALIRRFGDLTGVPVLLNTSFNLSDEPIVCAPVDALRTFLRSSIDLLCIEDFVIDGKVVPRELRESANEDQRFIAGADSQSSRDIYTFF